MSYHDGMSFTTYDYDTDLGSGFNCATDYHGAFWHKDCFYFNPNGRYGSSGDNQESMAQTDWNVYEAEKNWKMMFKTISWFRLFWLYIAGVTLFRFHISVLMNKTISLNSFQYSFYQSPWKNNHIYEFCFNSARRTIDNLRFYFPIHF